jgi:hypothetical protein
VVGPEEIELPAIHAHPARRHAEGALLNRDISHDCRRGQRLFCRSLAPRSHQPSAPSRSLVRPSDGRAGRGRIEFAFATNDSVAFRCFPLRLAATPLRSAGIGLPEEDLHLHGQYALASARAPRSSQATTPMGIKCRRHHTRLGRNRSCRRQPLRHVAVMLQATA